MAPVLGGVVRPAVAEAVACGEGAVEQDEVRVSFTQEFEQGQVPAPCGRSTTAWAALDLPHALWRPTRLLRPRVEA